MDVQTLIEIENKSNTIPESVNLSEDETAVVRASLELLLFRHNVPVTPQTVVRISILAEPKPVSLPRHGALFGTTSGVAE